MAAMSNYLENKLIDLVFRGGSFTPPANLYVGLFTGAPSDTGGGTEVNTTNTAYARVALNPSTGNWAATDAAGSTASTSGGTSGTTSNNTPITFATATNNWGTINAVGIYDNSTSGNLLWYGNLSSPQTVNSGGTFSFANAALAIQIDN